MKKQIMLYLKPSQVPVFKDGLKMVDFEIMEEYFWHVNKESVKNFTIQILSENYSKLIPLLDYCGAVITEEHEYDASPEAYSKQLKELVGITKEISDKDPWLGAFMLDTLIGMEQQRIEANRAWN